MKNRTGFLVCLFMTYFTYSLFSQNIDSTKNMKHFSGSVLVTNNGISLFPNLSLGKPAAIFGLSVGDKKISFEPEFRFSMEGKPWNFIFWFRYRLQSQKFSLQLGAHPAFNFKTQIISADKNEILIARRFLAGEIRPTYLLSKNIRLGVHFLRAHGLDKGGTRNTNFIAINSNFSNVEVFKNFLIGVTPQLFYLKMDDREGYYFTSTLSLSKKEFPLSISSIINQKIKSNIVNPKSFVWNVSLVYSFGNNYVRR